MQFQDGVWGGYFFLCCLCIRSRRGDKLGDNERRYRGGIAGKDVPRESLISSCDGSAFSTRNASGMVIVNRPTMCGGPRPQLPDLCCDAQLVHDVPVHFYEAFHLSRHWF